MNTLNTSKSRLTLFMLLLAAVVLVMLIYVKEWQIRKGIDDFNANQKEFTITVDSITPFLLSHPLRGFVLYNVAVQDAAGKAVARAERVAIGTFILDHDTVAINAKVNGLFALFELENQMRFFAGIPEAAPVNLDIDFSASHRGANINLNASMPQVVQASCAGETIWTMAAELPVAENIRKTMPFSVVQWAQFTLKNDGLVQSMLARFSKLGKQSPEQIREQAIKEMAKNFQLSPEAAAEIFDGTKTLKFSVDLKKGYNLPMIVLASDPIAAKDAYNRVASAVAP